MNLKESAASALLALSLLRPAPAQTKTVPAAPFKNDAALSAQVPSSAIPLNEPLKVLLAKNEQDPQFAQTVMAAFSPAADMRTRSAALTEMLKSLPDDRERKEFLASVQLRARQDMVKGVPHAMDIIELVVKKGADKEQLNAQNQNMMFDAIFSGKPQNITRMAALELKVDGRDLAGEAPLSYALPDFKLVDALLAADARATGLFALNNDETLLYKALTEGFSDSAKSLANGETVDAIIGGERLPIKLLQLDKSICDTGRKLAGLRILLNGGMDPNIETLNGVSIALVASDLRNENPVVKNDPIDPAGLALAMLVFHGMDDEALYSTNENAPTSFAAPRLLSAFEGYETAITVAKKLRDGNVNGAASYPGEFLKYAVAVGAEKPTIQALLQVPEVQEWLADTENMSTALQYTKIFGQDALRETLSNVNSLQASHGDPQLIAAAYKATENEASSLAESGAPAKENTAAQPKQPEAEGQAAATPQSATVSASDKTEPDTEHISVKVAPAGIPSPQPQDPFYDAVTRQDAAAFNALIAANAAMDQIYTIDDRLGITGNLLHLVATYASGDAGIEMAKALEGKIDVNSLASNGWNAVNFTGDEKLIGYFADRGAALNCSEQRVGHEDSGVMHGINALDIAIDDNNQKALVTLIKKGAVNQLSEEEVDRSIARASRMGHEDMANAIKAAKRVRRPEGFLITR